MKRLILALVTVALAAAPAAWAVNPGMELWVPAVARAEGAQNTHWMTDLTLHNPTQDALVVTLQFLARGVSDPVPVDRIVDLAPGQTMVLEDVLDTLFDLEEDAGALRISANSGIAATSRIYNSAGGGATFGQGVDAVPSTSALNEGHSTTVLGLSQGPAARTNVIALDITGVGSVLDIALIDADGYELASTSVELGPWESTLKSVGTLFGMNAATDTSLQVTTVSGSAVVMASRVDTITGDPATLTPLMPGRGAMTPAGVYWGTVVDSFVPGGIQMIVNENAEVNHLHLSFPSYKIGCSFNFPAGGDFTSGVPLTDFEADEGVTWLQEYAVDDDSAGQIQWTVKLDGVEANAYASGTVSGVGEGFGGPCDGSHGTFNIHISRPMAD